MVELELAGSSLFLRFTRAASRQSGPQSSFYFNNLNMERRGEERSPGHIHNQSLAPPLVPLG